MAHLTFDYDLLTRSHEAIDRSYRLLEATEVMLTRYKPSVPQEAMRAVGDPVPPPAATTSK